MPEPTGSLDALHQPVIPIEPRAEFAAELRTRLGEALGLARTGGTAMSITASPTTARHIPPGYHSVSVGLAVHDARAAIAFYQEAFGAVVVQPPYVGDDGRVGHAELHVGDSTFSLSDEYPEEEHLAPATVGGTTVQLTIYVEDCDAVFARAVAAGAVPMHEPGDAPYGARSAKVRDPFGHNWSIQTHVADLSDDELREVMAAGGYAPEEPPASAAVDPGPGAPGTVDLGARAPVAAVGPSTDRRGQLFYFTLSSQDVEASARFFRDLLGWELHEGNPGSFHIANLTQPGGLFGDDVARPTLYFVVDDIDAAVEQARRLGAVVDEPEQFDSGSSVRLVAPGGVEVWLSVPASGY